jgi:hypothetical protein
MIISIERRRNYMPIVPIYLTIMGINIVCAFLSAGTAIARLKRRGYKEAKEKTYASETIMGLIKVIAISAIPIRNIIYPILVIFTDRVNKQLDEKAEKLIAEGKWVKVEDEIENEELFTEQNSIENVVINKKTRNSEELKELRQELLDKLKDVSNEIESYEQPINEEEKSNQYTKKQNEQSFIKVD